MYMHCFVCAAWIRRLGWDFEFGPARLVRYLVNTKFMFVHVGWFMVKLKAVVEHRLDRFLVFTLSSIEMAMKYQDDSDDCHIV